MIRAPHISYLPPVPSPPGATTEDVDEMRKGHGMRHTHEPSDQNGLGAAVESVRVRDLFMSSTDRHLLDLGYFELAATLPRVPSQA